ncbi:MAG: DNA polymerase I, partial [Lachnospiraceae bacterium]|nr:DNA polymerase I [Lachnospiraceae bacterium]
LATININADFEFSFEEAKIGDFYTEDAYILCKQLEFKNILSRFKKDAAVSNSQAENFKELSELADVEALFERMGKLCGAKEGCEIGLSVLRDGKSEEEFAGIAIAFAENEVFFIPCQGFITMQYLADKLINLNKNKLCKLNVCDIKQIYDIIAAEEKQATRSGICFSCGINERTSDEIGQRARTRGFASLDEESAGEDVMAVYREKKYFDILLAAYLLNPLKNDYDVESIANEYLNLILPDRKQVCEKLSLVKAMEQKPGEFLNFACFQAYVCLMAAKTLKGKLEEQGMLSLLYEIEMPLTKVLYDMEKYGIIARRDELKTYGEALKGRIAELEQSIYDKAGIQFNINSPKQLGEILFEKMGIKGAKKTKTGYSTAADILEKLAPEYPVIADILEYRGLTKLKSTYADGLAAYIGEDSRIHSTFNQTITATGRISSTEPNLQNIPIRMELGRKIRKVFVPEDGYLFMDADYSQIELRVLAHMSDDKQLIEAYQMDEDIHRITASKVFHTPFEEVTDLQRRNAKAVNFGIVYGISSFGLSQDLSISKKEAAEYIEQYFATYPGIKKFLDKLVEDAKAQGYVTTMFGRRRPIPELSSSNFMQRSFGERVAMNSPIQGTAADIIKIAMINVWSRIKNEGLRSRLILQVHDELLIETYEPEEDKVREILTQEMQKAAKLSVALEIDLHTGMTWYDAK